MKKDNINKIVIISIKTFYAKQIFNKTKIYEFRKLPIKQDLLNKKIYVYSAKEDKAIIGYFKVSDILKGSTDEILKATGYDMRKDGHEIVEYFGENREKCYALHLYGATLFKEKLRLSDMKNISSNLVMPQYIKYIYENNSLYDVIKKWDDTFSQSDNAKEMSTIDKEQILNEINLGKKKN